MPRNFEHHPIMPERSVLTFDQVHQYLRDGYVVVSGLIPSDIVRTAEEAAWRNVKLDRDDPASWAKAPHSTFCVDPDLMAVYTPEFLTAAGQLVSPDPHKFPVSSLPYNAYVITTKPTTNPWQIDNIHVDGLGNWDYLIESFPPNWFMFTMIYLHDIASHGGATLVWPGSHLKFKAMLRATPEKYRFLAALADDFAKVDIGDPVELVVKAGDVAFIDHMMVHAGSMNTSKRPRFAMNMKW